MASFEDVEKQIGETTDRISGRVRDLAVAMVAFGWSLIEPKSSSGGTAGGQVNISISGPVISELRWASLAIAAAVLALTFDFLQYVLIFAYLENSYRAAKKVGAVDITYPTHSWVKLGSWICFTVKVLAMAVAVLLIFYSVAPVILKALIARS
jgi:hypothetical protein